MSIEIHADGPVPDGMLDAFWRYDTALLANDVAALDALFASSPDTLRADGNGVLVGHDAIADFRSARSERPNRRVTRLWLRVLSERQVYTTAAVVAPSGGTGLQTQLWVVADGAWRVAAAHVTAAPPVVDAAVWRVAGSPLVAGAAEGPLRGETVAVKDLFAVEGIARSGGVRAYLAEQRPQPRQAAAVSALLAAGADVAGVAHTDQFAFGLAGRNADFGTPTNPAAPDRLPGGSSSGPAVAVARGWATVGLGTDTAGSIRVPASYQGLWGFRPTHGAVDIEGVLALAPSFDVVGWMTRDGATAQRVGEVLLPPEKDEDLTGVVRLADLEGLADADVRAAVGEAVARWDATPWSPWTGSLDVDPAFRAFRLVQAAEAWREHGAWLSKHPDGVAPEVAERFAAGREVTPEAEAEARDVLASARERWAEAVGDGALLIPTVGSSVPRLNAAPAQIDAHRAATLPLTTLASLSGLPCVNLPAGRVGGAPFGVSLIGPAGRDRALLRLAVERTL